MGLRVALLARVLARFAQKRVPYSLHRGVVELLFAYHSSMLQQQQRRARTAENRVEDHDAHVSSPQDFLTCRRRCRGRVDCHICDDVTGSAVSAFGECFNSEFPPVMFFLSEILSKNAYVCERSRFFCFRLRITLIALPQCSNWTTAARPLC